MTFIDNIKRSENAKAILIILLLISSQSVQAHPFLWKVTGEHDFYLFGTIHLPDPRVTILPPEVEQALNDSTAFYAELDLSESNTMQIKQAMWLPEQQTLHELLSESVEKKVTDYLYRINPELNLEFFSKQKIWVLAVTLTVLEQQLKYPGQPPLDAKLFQHATSLGKITGGLETVEEQLEVFESLTIAEQTTFLNDTVEFLNSNKNTQNDFIEQSLDAYLQGDLDRLMSHLMSYMKDDTFYDELLERLINKRNIKMTESILSLVKNNTDEKYFFAVGAGHFWGDTGINTLLIDQGYSIHVIE